MLIRRGSALFAFLAAVCLLLATTAFADSQARIVRLSYIDGDVQIDRNIGQGFEDAVLNMPVIQGTRIYTGNDGRVEVEFENGSTVRLSGPSDLMFRQLTLRSSGDKVSMLDLREGLAYFDINHKGDDDFRLVIGSREFNIRKSARFRVRVEGSDVQLAVSKGQVEYVAGARDIEVKKNESMALDLRDPDRYFLSKNYDEYASDDWDRARDQYREQNENASNYNNNSPYAYGWSDLNYYGDYFSAPGYGTLWRPYGMSAGWDPFSYGAWSWYPGFGWTYVSAYPWGWTPYRYGSWMYLNNYGWCWQPSNSWNNWNTGPVIVNAPGYYVVPRAPAGGHRGGTVVTGLANPSRPPVAGARPTPLGGTPSPIARGGRVTAATDRDRPVQGRPTAARPAVTGAGAMTGRSGTGRPIEIQRPNAQNQIPAESIRVAPTDMQPPVRSEVETVAPARPVDGRNDEDTAEAPRGARSGVFDRPRDADATERGPVVRGEPRAVPEPSAVRETPRSSAPVTTTSEPRPSAPVIIRSEPSMGRGASSSAPRAEPAPAPRAEPAPAPRAAPPPSAPAPSAPRSVPAPAPRGRAGR